MMPSEVLPLTSCMKLRLDRLASVDPSDRLLDDLFRD